MMALVLTVSIVLVGCSSGSDRSVGPDPASTDSQSPDWPAGSGPGPVIAVVGDSYTTGSEMDSGPASNWSALMAEGLRRDRPDLQMHVEAGAGSGYAVGGARGLDFEQLARLSMPTDADLIIVFGSLNDGRSQPSTVAVAARSLMTWLQDERPDATVLVIGPPWMDERVPTNLLLIRDEVRTAALDIGATFLDPLAEGWFAGDAASLIGDDGVHPTDDGQHYLAELVTPRVEQLLAAPPTP
jgi:lysophospholipase L1-like esterase